MNNGLRRYGIWIVVALVGALCWAMLALARGETINAGWLLFAALASYAIGYRFYARFIQNRVLGTDDSRATPAERLNNGRDFEPMDRRVLFGHHFAAIAGAGPLVGPVLAAQMGFLPGTIWIIVGVILAGAVQDMTILFFSTRRDGKSLGQMAREEIGPVGGAAALIAVLSIMVILLAVLALVVVLALAASPWGSFSLALTLPIALLMGVYLRFLRQGGVLELRRGLDVHAQPARLRPHHLRLRRLGPARVAPSGPPRLPLDLHEDRDHSPPRRRYSHNATPDAHAQVHRVRIQWRGARFRRRPLPVRVYYHSLRGALGLPLAGGFGDYAQADPERVAGAHDRVRGDANRVVRCRDGDNRGDDPRPWRVLRDERQPGSSRRHRPVGLPGREQLRVLGGSADAYEYGQSRGRGVHYRQDGRCPDPRRGDKRDLLRRHRWHRAAGVLVPLRHNVRGSVHPDDRGCGDAGRAVHDPGPRGQRLAALRTHLVVARKPDSQRHYCRGLGLLPLRRCERSPGRHQPALPTLRHREPAPGRRRPDGRDDHPDQDGQAPLRLGYGTAAGLGRGRDAYGKLAEDLLP